ncbi:MAG: DUF4976 domain-containing protein [Isosphaeraceae bacterium]|nr:DUF4976 domain-containing protein [Isosphaeraceae bacterium]
MQGSDLSAVVLGRTDRGPDSAFFQIFVPFAGDQTPHPWRAVRTDRYLYARTETGPWLLYDLESDPYELHNLVADATQAPLRERLEAKLQDWMKRTADSWSYDSHAWVEDKGRLYRFQTFYTIEEYLQWAKEHPDLAPRD